MVDNYLNLTNVTSLPDLITVANQNSEGYFCIGILISLFAIITLSAMAQGKVKEGIVAGSFITLLGSILMRIAGLIPDFVMVFCIIAFFGAMFMMFSESSQ